MIPHLARTAVTFQSFALAVLPHGGQRSARRNAWASMSADAVLARARREADAALAFSLARASAMSQHPAARAR